VRRHGRTSQCLYPVTTGAQGPIAGAWALRPQPGQQRTQRWHRDPRAPQRSCQRACQMGDWAI